MSDQSVVLILQIALTAFTGLLAWFLRELWELWKESARDRIRTQAEVNQLSRQILEATGLMRAEIAELRLNVVQDYLRMDEFKEFREEYVRKSIHDLREKVQTLMAKAEG